MSKLEIKKCVLEIIDSLCDRNGFDDWWCNLNDDVETEITAELESIIENRLNKKMNKEEAKDRLIQLLMGQVVDLSMMSRIELGDDVIAEIKRLKEIINKPYEENLC